MQNALLPNGRIVNAKEYDHQIHGKEIYCPECKVPLIWANPQNDDRSPYFRTTGYGESDHKPFCPHNRVVKILNTMKKVNQFTTRLSDIPEAEKVVIKLNLKTDMIKVPQGEVNEIPNSHPKKSYKYSLRYNRRQKKPIRSISSLSAIARLIMDNKEEELNKVFLDYNGKQLPLSDLVVDQTRANELAFNEGKTSFHYIVYGRILKVVKTEKVMFLNFDRENGTLKPFAAFVFAQDFSWFTYTKDKLENNAVLVWGQIQLNRKYKKAEIQLRSNNNIYIFSKK